MNEIKLYFVIEKLFKNAEMCEGDIAKINKIREIANGWKERHVNIMYVLGKKILLRLSGCTRYMEAKEYVVEIMFEIVKYL